MDLAYRAAERSHDQKFGVGCVVVTPDHMMTLGWNGTPPGDDNEMREPVIEKCDHGVLHFRMKTKPTVMHAEFNALAKFSGSTASAAGSTLYTTLSPCVPCAILTYRAKVAEVVYDANYTESDGISFLRDHGVSVRKV